MAEEAEGLAAREEVNALAGGEPADPVAMALALGGASREEADGFLRDQRRLTALQISRLKAQDTHFHEEAELELAHLRWRRFEDRMKGATRLMLVAVGALLLGAIALAMWEASRAEGLVVDAFSVPPAFAASGVAANVLADDLTTRVAAIRDFATDHSLAPSKDVSQDRNQDIKVEIPETGVSLAQAWRYLKTWLGHERRLTGNLRDMGDGKAALTIALDGRNAFVLQGTARELDKLEDEAAEKVFAELDPTNYVIYLSGKGRDTDCLAAAARLPQLAKTPAEMSNAYALWSVFTFYVAGDFALAAERARLSTALDSKTTASHLQMMWLFMDQGHDEEALVQAREIATKREEDEPVWRNSDGVAYAKLQATDLRNITAGDFREALSEPCSRRCLGGRDPIGSDLKRAEYAARLHDQKLSRTLTTKAAAEGPTDPRTTAADRLFCCARGTGLAGRARVSAGPSAGESGNQSHTARA